MYFNCQIEKKKKKKAVASFEEISECNFMGFAMTHLL